MQMKGILRAEEEGVGGNYVPRRDEGTHAQRLLPDKDLQRLIRDLQIPVPLPLQLFGQTRVEFKAADHLVLRR